MLTQTPYQGTIVTLWPEEIDTLGYIVRQHDSGFGVELGTYKGGSALVMVNAGLSMLYTYDKRDVLEVRDARVIYRVADIWEPEVTEEIKRLCKSGEPKLLFCDGGDKKREINTFGPHLIVGDVLAAHDYPIEFKDSDISGMIGGNGYERVKLPWDNRIIAWRKT